MTHGYSTTGNAINIVYYFYFFIFIVLLQCISSGSNKVQNFLPFIIRDFFITKSGFNFFKNFIPGGSIF